MFDLRTPNNIEMATGAPKEATESGIWTWQETDKNQDVNLVAGTLLCGSL